MAECICREANRLDPTRMPGPYCRVRRAVPASRSCGLRGVLQRGQDASGTRQGCACITLHSDRGKDHPAADPGRAAPPLCAGLSLRQGQGFVVLTIIVAWCRVSTGEEGKSAILRAAGLIAGRASPIRRNRVHAHPGGWRRRFARRAAAPAAPSAPARSRTARAAPATAC